MCRKELIHSTVLCTVNGNINKSSTQEHSKIYDEYISIFTVCSCNKNSTVKDNKHYCIVNDNNYCNTVH